MAVQNVDGTRFQSSFHSTTSLWDVLIQHKLDSSPGGMEPSLSYMRQEVCHVSTSCESHMTTALYR